MVMEFLKSQVLSCAKFLKLHRRQRHCCRRGIQLLLLGLVVTVLCAGLLTLILLWHPHSQILGSPTYPSEPNFPIVSPTVSPPAPSHAPPTLPRGHLALPQDTSLPPFRHLPHDWETARNLKQLEEATAQKVSQVSKDLERHKGDQMAQKSQESELSRNLDGLRADLSNLKSHSLNERREALDSLGRLQEEVGKLWMEIRESVGSVCNICPEEWIYFQKKCYYFGKGTKKWIQARNACSKLHGRLVSVRSQEEQDFLTKHSNKRGSWIGLRDLDIEGEFIWMDSSPLGYSNWQPGEPNDAGQGENCVMMQGSGQWNDVFCGSYLNSWVCDRLATC
ncbi:low affinity immunoglobulin epsilon Fc receptor [Megaptera novaeangliae]